MERKETRIETENDKQNKLILSAFWDYNVNPRELIDILNGQLDEIPYFKKDKIFLRLIERLSWYDILEIIELDRIKSLLTEELISNIRIPELRIRYEFIRKILLGEAISFTGWGPEYYQQIKYSLFSNRWYSFKQTLL